MDPHNLLQGGTITGPYFMNLRYLCPASQYIRKISAMLLKRRQLPKTTTGRSRALKSAAERLHLRGVEDALVTHVKEARFRIGEVVRHRIYPFRGVIFDVDPEFANTEDWWLSIPEGVRPRKDQPFYHLLAENAETTYIAYVSEQNLVPDETGEPLSHPQIDEMFAGLENGLYAPRRGVAH